MRTSLLLICLAAGVPALSAQKNTCDNPRTQWVINPVYVDGATATAIQGDGSPYVDGQTGVTAVIHVCSGTYDATLLLNKRKLTFAFTRLLASNGNTPSWALSGATFSGDGFMNVHNIFFVPAGTDRNHEYTFTTWFGSNTPATGNPDFRMANPSAAVSTAGSGTAALNAPYPNSLVNVRHCPANTNTGTCPNIVRETWLVYPDPNPTAAGVGVSGAPIAQVGTLLTTSKGSLVNSGEFSMPFFFTISLLN